MAPTLDDRVEACLRDHSDGLTFKAIQAKLGVSSADFRDLDKALQRLRRKGKIFFFSPVVGWKLETNR